LRRSEKEKIIALLIDSLSDDSLESIRSGKLYDQLIESSDLRGLWALVKKVHVLKDGSHVFRMEENLRSQRMGNLSLDEHLRVFRLQHGATLDAGSTMAESLAVHILLLSFQGSPIQDAARRIIEGSNSPGYPKTTTEVRIMLEPAWDMIQLESLKVTEENNLTFYASDRGQGKPKIMSSCASQMVVDCCAMAVDHFTVEQKRKAALVRQLHYDLNHPSGEQLCDLLESTCLLDTPLTAKDVRVSERINGACPHCLVGKFPTPPALPSQSVPASAPGELLHTDIAFFLEGKKNRVPTWLSLTISVTISIAFGWRGSHPTCF
jgi:hypothetical protein